MTAPVVASPFGGSATQVATLASAWLVDAYRDKCGLDVTRWLAGIDELGLYECARTGVRFWRPAEAAGDEEFYRALSAAWTGYYRDERWEYAAVRRWLAHDDSVLEVGCGQGWFLKSLQGHVAHAAGLELNRQAIATTATTFPVLAQTLAQHAAAQPGAYSAVCSFHVIEHVADPAAILRDALAALRPGGLLIVSTPNRDAPAFASRSDPFDLPPHHLNHFDATSYRRIAGVMGLQVHALRTQPRYAAAATSPLQRLAQSMAAAWWRLTRAPGEAIVVALRKP